MGILDAPGLPSFRKAAPLLDGVQLLAYGHSYLIANGVAIRSYWDRLRTRINPGVFWNGGVGGRLCEDTCQFAYGTFPEPRQGNQLDGVNAVTDIGTLSVNMSFYGQGVTIFDVGRNSAGYDGSTANGGTPTKARTSFSNALHALVALARSGHAGVYPNLAALTITTTAGSPVVACAAVTANMKGRNIAGAGITGTAYIGTVNPGVSFRLSTSATSQVDVNASASGTNAVTVQPLRAGTWTAEVSTFSSGGYRYWTTTPGATATYALPSSGGRAWWVTQGVDSVYTGRTGSTYSVSVDGGPAITGGTNDQHRRTVTGVASSAGYCQKAVDLGVLSAGWHTVVVTHTGSSGQYLFDDSTLVEDAAPCTVVIPKIPQAAALGYSTFYTGCSPSWVIDQIYNALIDAELARWPADQSVISWDPNAAGWSPATHIGASDGLHPNDRGAAFYADGLMALLNTLPARNGLVKL